MQDNQAQKRSARYLFNQKTQAAAGLDALREINN